MKVKFGKSFLEDLQHKMWLVHDEPELLESYTLTQEQVYSFIKTLPANPRRTTEIEIPDYMLACVRSEMENMAEIAWANADSEGISAIGYASAIDRQLEKLT